MTMDWCQECELPTPTSSLYGYEQTERAGLLCASCLRQRIVQWALITPDDHLDSDPFTALWRVDG